MVTAVIVVALLGSAPAGAAAKTVVSTFVPFSSGGKPTIPVEGKLKDGGCDQRSQTSPKSRDDAWICQIGVTLHDPCFLGNSTNHLLCPNRSMSSALLVYDGPVGPPKPSHSGSASRIPFNVELASGTHCVYVDSGEVASFGAKSAVLGYECPHNLGLWGAFDRRGKTWTIIGAPAQGNISAYRHTERVVHVWR